jgi:hypothetical protein
MKADKLVELIDTLVELKIQKMLPKLLKEEMKKILSENNTQPKANQKLIKKKKYSSNPLVNDILNETKPFKSDIQSTMNEGVDKTVSFDSSLSSLDRQSLRSVFAEKMGYGDIVNNTGGGNKAGLNVSTGISSLDRVLNRDNTELVKRMMEKKSN